MLTEPRCITIQVIRAILFEDSPCCVWGGAHLVKIYVDHLTAAVQAAHLAVGESSVILMTQPFSSLLKQLLKVEGGAAE